MAKTTKITFHVYDKRVGGQFTDFQYYYNSLSPYDLNKYIEFQSDEIDRLGFAVVGYDYETRYTGAELFQAFESSNNYCVEPGYNKIPEMPRYSMPDPPSFDAGASM